MSFHGAFCKEKPAGDGGVGLSFGDEGQDFVFARCEYGERIVTADGGKQGGDDF